MSVLFKIEGKVVVPTTETLIIEPFKTIWDRDESEHKSTAMQEFAYIEFMISQLRSNPFSGYDKEKRHVAILENQVKDPEWLPDEFVIDGMYWLEKFQQEASLTFNYYKSVRRAINKMQVFFDTFDMNEINLKTGNPVYKPRDITSALKDTEDLLTKFDNIKKKVEKELFETTRRKGDKEISPFAKRNM